MNRYSDKPLNFNQQIALLKSNGLAFADEQKALHTLRHVSYFRMKSYLMPLMDDKMLHTFKKGASFEQAFELYKFDSCLRKLVASELEKIEVSIRTQMAYTLADETGIYWFSDSANFSNPTKHAATLVNLKAELDRSDEDQILRFKSIYSDPYPPAWMTLEVSSFGTLSMLFKLLKPNLTKRKIANFYGVSDSVFESWLHSIVYVRNICAHHSRLWNKTLRIQPLFPRKTTFAFLSSAVRSDRIYYVLCIMQYLLRTVNPSTSFSLRLKSLLAEFPNVDISAMGFVQDWDKEMLWQ
ncbi:MAG: Abi family protein [Bacteroidales bacterium]|nr:Abi family protein [Bacteroidales bacterium]